ncbi:hypothetical protein M3589_04615 [Heyndrickxia oleronia]|uniref:hypothetical protein n=1 Tax=Heyndrickxia oleronia TaxID=38875 RepID=UPI00203A7960|nr:hypothetical protein [Heyndrickxia oleronia]MCM3237006.1 hypothetical protein [Heyndrickxia oleronia]
MKTLFKWLLSGVFIYSVFKYRYKLLNVVMGSYWLRKIAIRAVMSIPGVKSKFMESAFR